MDARRIPARVRRIKDIDISNDSKVRILCKVVERSADSFFAEDATGKVQVLCNPEIATRLYDGQLIRIYAQVIPSEEGIRLRAEIVQDATGLDLNLYKIAEGMWIEANSQVALGQQ